MDSTTSSPPPHTTMPIPIIATGLREGLSAIPHVWTILRIAPWVLVVAVLKYYFEGARNSSERMMRSKVIMVTVRHPPPLLQSMQCTPNTRTNKQKGRNLRNRRRSSPRTRNARRPSNPPNPPTTLRHLPLRTHRRPPQKHQKPPHLCRASGPNIALLHPHLRHKMDRQHPAPQTRQHNPVRQHDRAVRARPHNRRHRPRMANELPVELPPAEHSQSGAARPARAPRRACDFRFVRELHRRRLQWS